MMVSPTKLVVHFATSEPTSQSASPSHLKTRKSEDDLRLFGKFCPQNCKKLFPERDGTVTFIVPALIVRSEVLSIKDRRNGVGKPVFKLAPLGNEQMFDLAVPDLCVPDILDDALRQVILQASHLAQDRTANV